MSRKMLINARHRDELRVAIIDEGVLEAYEVEAAESGLARGNIYRGVVAKVESSLNAAFIDYGAERHGFLPGDDIVPEAYQKRWGGSGRPKIADVLERGKPILVQVTKEAVGQKGAALTTSVSLAGRYLVLTPFDDTRGVSRKVEDDEVRKRLKEHLATFSMPDGCGAIARTNAQDQNKTNLNRDLNALLRLWKKVLSEFDNGKGPRLLYSDQDLVLQALRDYLDTTIEEVHVDDDDVVKKAEQYMRTFMPRARTQVVRYDGRIPLFARYHLDEQIDRIYDRVVQLPSGGSIVIDGTEALTAIDVNSGRTRGGNSHEDTVSKTNLEAAEEVARQLRMRDIGGLVVVDFIDMRQRRNHRKVEKALREAMKVDRARVSIGRISENGLLEINRQRIKQTLQLRTHRPCPTCNGSGTIASPEFVALGLLRRIEARAAAGDLKAVRIALHPELADGIQNNRRKELAELEHEYGIRIDITAATHLHRSQEQVEWKRREIGKDEPAIAPREAPAALTASDLLDGGGSSRRRRRGGDKDREKRRTEEAEPQAETPPSRPVSEDGDEGEERRSRRRRSRRRRRRGSGGEEGAQEASAEKTTAVAEVEAAAEDTDTQPEQGADGDSGEGGERRSRRRRRGGRRRSRSRSGEKDSQPVDPDEQPRDITPTGKRLHGSGRRGASQPPPPPPVDLSDSRAREEALRRKFGQPWYVRPVAETASSSTDAEAPAEEQAPRPKAAETTPRPAPSRTAAAVESGDGEGTEKPRRSRRRRSSPKGAEDAVAEDTVAEVQAAPSMPESSEERPAADEGDAPKRASRRRKTQAAPESEVAKPEVKESADEVAKKPTRRRSPSRSEAETVEPTPATDTGGDETPAKRPTRRRKATAEAAAPAEESASAKPKKASGGRSKTAAKPVGDEAEAAEPKKRATRRRKTGDETSASGGGGQEDGDAKPATTRRTTRRRKSEPDEAEAEG
ncbi:MAG: Rne/Rng family ribonuclease [Acidobacteria bacterium]|nr:Rne/Rng family ribonuclease [Acidobacteriota bacterium]